MSSDLTAFQLTTPTLNSPYPIGPVGRLNAPLLLLLLIILALLPLPTVGVAAVGQPTISVNAFNPYQLFIYITGPAAPGVNASSLLGGVNCTLLYKSASMVSGVLRVGFVVPWNGRYIACNLTSIVKALQGTPMVKLVNTSNTVLVSATLSRGVLRVAYLGPNWPMFALSIIILVWPIPAVAILGRRAVERQRASREVSQIYSYGIRVGFPLYIAWFVVFMVGLAANVVYATPIQFALRPLISSQAVNMGITIAAPLAATLAAIAVVQRHYYNALKRLIGEERWRGVVEERIVNRYAAALFILIMAVASVYGLASWLIYAKLTAPWLIKGVMSAAVFVTMPIVVGTSIPRLLLRLTRAYGNVLEDPTVQGMVNDIWARMGRPGPPPRAYVADYIMGMRYNAVATIGGKVFVAKPMLSLLTPEELYSVLVHEVSHIRHRHISVMMLISVVFVAAVVVPLEVSISYGLTHPNPLIPLILVIYFITLLAVSIPAIMFIKRRLEAQADDDAAKAGFNPRAFISALGKITRANLMPARFGRVESLYLTHPAPVARVLKIADKYGIPRDEALKIFGGEG